MTPPDLLRALFDAAVAAADPMHVIPNVLPEKPEGRVVVIGAGKASARMAEAVEQAWGPCEGFVITRYGYARPTQQIKIVEAAHPIPDEAGSGATKELIEYVTDFDEDTFVLCLISGGGSALLTSPAGGITLEEKQDLTRQLLESGAPIGDINGVRKQISEVKGGGLAAAVYPAPMLTLLISDVPGDCPGDIASGPTVASEDNAQLTLDVLERWGATPAPSIIEYLNGDSTVLAQDDPRLSKVTNRVVAAPSHSLEAAKKVARANGMNVKILGDAIEGEAREEARRQVQLALEIQQDLKPGDAPVVLLSGGECTVTGWGGGVGGPNAEFCLSAAIELNGRDGIYALACDTDGVDGAAEVAGAIVHPDTLARSDVDAQDALRRSDSHSFFAALGDQVVPGPTLTNVNDFRAILILPR